jgi:dTDP-4-dehydrorhamnose reductase
MKWMILGANGQLGRCAQDLFDAQDIEYIALSSSDVDICDSLALRRSIQEYRPEVILNAAAYTAVDQAEGETDKAYSVNANAVGDLAALCKINDIFLIHISTDYVFDGCSDIAYTETDIVGPTSVYGASKLLGEHKVQDSGCRAVIIRTAWVFSEYGNNFVQTMLRLGQERDELRVVSDQVGCPTYAGDIAEAAFKLAKSSYDKPDFLEVYHYSGDIAVSWWSFAREVHLMAKSLGLITDLPHLYTIGSESYPTAAKRPQFSVLDCKKINLLGIASSDWKSAIARIMSTRLIKLL